MEGEFTMISKKKKWLFGTLIIIGLLFYKHLYNAPQIFGVVKDASTGTPITNAVIVATWYSQRPGFHSPNREFFEVEETVTNAHGEYLIRGWTIRLLPRFFASIATDDPKIMAYKYGYLPKKSHNFNRSWRTHGFFINWSGNADIELQPLDGDIKTKVDKFESAQGELQLLYGCDWMKTKNLLMEADKQFYENEKYYSSLHDEPVVPWFLYEFKNEQYSSCPGAIDLLSESRERNIKEIK